MLPPLSRRALLAGAGALALGAGFGAAGTRATANGPKLVATTGMIADTLARVGAGRATVHALMGTGVDPHAYRQTRSDIEAMLRADAVFWHGLNLEAQLQRFFGDLAEIKPVLALAEALPPKVTLLTDAETARPDPHIWMDPRLWAEVVHTAETALMDLDPEAAALYRANGAAYRAEIAALDAYAQQVLASVPEGARVLITAHDAFGYFGRAYGYEVLGIQGMSTESEAGLADLEALVTTITARKIGAIFVETSVSDRNSRALIEGAAAKGHALAIGGALYSDAMGPPARYEGSYIGMIDHNVTTIARALGGTAPARGLNNRLDL